MEWITGPLFWLSSGLLAPVIAALLLGVVYALMVLGAYTRAALKRRAQSGLDLASLPADASAHSRLRQWADGRDDALGHAVQQLLSAAPAHREYLIARFEAAMAQRLAGPRLLTRLGPMLGLMGTLIPLGPALTGLAAGDLAGLAGNMHVAFATTVIGLLCGGVGYLVAQAGLRWASEDLNTLEFVRDCVQEQP